MGGCMGDVCMEHSGVCAKIEALENDHQDCKEERVRLWAEIDGIKKMVIGTLVMVILQILAIAGAIVVKAM